MLSTLPWALMALAPLAEARWGIRPRADNDDALRCCPCIPTSISPQDAPVTVTVTSPQETVTIDHTIVLPATTVFVTHTLASGSPATVTQQVTVHPESPAKIETVVNAISSSEHSAQNEPAKTVTMTVQAGGSRPDSPKTVTVTLKPDEPNAVQTPPNSDVTITITQQSPGSQPSAEASRSNAVSVATAQASHSAESKPSIKTVTVVQKPSSPSVETVTFVENPAEPSATAAPSADQPLNSTVETVTFVENPVSPSTTTVTLANNPSKAATTDSTVETVTFVESPASPSTATVTLTNGPSLSSTMAAASASNPSNSTAETVTFVENPPMPSSTSPGPSSQTPTSVVNSAKPDVETVAFVPNPPNPTITTSSSLQPAITAPPQVGTISQSIDHFTTITQTVPSIGGDINGDVNIEITIINIFTGEVVCKKKGTDEPCDPKPSPCLTTGIFTSTATAFNTVIVTIDPGMWTNGTSATVVAPPLGTGIGSPVLRRGRTPLIRRRL
ncbi:hypothetical protein V8C35DRAFT_309731 [Trichoderma chlorosporum]